MLLLGLTGAYRGTSLGAFGGVAGLFALFYLSGVPRVRKDILEVTSIWQPQAVQDTNVA